MSGEGVWVEVAPGRKRLVYPDQKKAGKKPPKQYGSCIRERNIRLYGMDTDIAMEVKDKTGKIKEAWVKSGGGWGRVSRGAKYDSFMEGPRVRDDSDFRKLLRITREVDPRGFHTQGDD